MRLQYRRLAGLVRRYRTDRRLPPEVRDFYVSTTRLRLGAALKRKPRVARLISSTSSSGSSGVVPARLDRSLADAGHRLAQSVVSALQSADINIFLVARRNDGFEFGIALEDRDRSLDVLHTRLARPEHVLTWEHGARSTASPLADIARSRGAHRSRRWSVHSAFSWGNGVVGESAATHLTFWEVGTSGQRELVGTRGQERFHVDTQRKDMIVDGRTYPGLSTFPVGRSLDEFDGDIDIVYTWVDSGDATWQHAFQEQLSKQPGSPIESAFDPARFRSRDELRYSLRSVWAYCGWARNIYIVTADQVPSWLADHPRVRIVSHTEILPGEALPTFNSHAIEAALHRIDGLAEHFVYFNDDMFVGRPLRPETFFTPNGLARVFQGNWRVAGAESEGSLAVDTAARRGRELLDTRFGRVATYMPLHSPYPLRRSVIEQVEHDFPDEMARTLHSRFRSSSDISVAASLAQHYGVALGKGVASSIHTEYVHVEAPRLSWALDRIRLADDVDTFCLNETKDVPGSHTRREAMLADFFEEMYPVAAPWEKLDTSERGSK